MNRLILFSLLTLLGLSVSAQSQLASPLRLPTAPSGTFAEIRTNHYHGGIDLRVGGDEGVGAPVYAPADGYVSRICISAYSGGKMLYIDHPGGLTTVYMHLDGYNSAIGDFVWGCQQRLQSYTFDTTVAKGRLPVRKGELIAYAGNTGMSGGPHLHYEVRNTVTQHAYNPLNYGLSIDDSMKPTIRGIRLLPVDDKCRIEGSDKPYQLEKKDTVTVLGRFYVGVYATDMSRGSTYRNGYERIDIWVDGKPFFQYRVDKIDFDNGRALNAQIDYEHYLATKQGYVVTRRLPGDPIKPARTYGDGSIGFVASDTSAHRITVQVSDFSGNSAVRQFYVRNTVKPLVQMHAVPRHVSLRELSDTFLYQSPFTLIRGDYQIEMPAGMLYYNDRLVHGKRTDRRYISPVVTVKPWRSPYPPHKTFTLRLPLPVGYEPSQLVVCALKNDKPTACPTRLVTRRTEGRTGEWLEADVRDFGLFVVACDTEAPAVRPLNFAEGKKVKESQLRMRISDNLSGIRDYRCFINDEWVLAEFDGKSSTLTVSLNKPQKITGGRPIRLRVTLTDCCGNVKDVTYRIILP